MGFIQIAFMFLFAVVSLSLAMKGRHLLLIIFEMVNDDANV